MDEATIRSRLDGVLARIDGRTMTEEDDRPIYGELVALAMDSPPPVPAPGVHDAPVWPHENARGHRQYDFTILGRPVAIEEGEPSAWRRIDVL